MSKILKRSDENRITLDSKHQEIVKKFKNDSKTIPQKKDRIKDLEILIIACVNEENYEKLNDLQTELDQLKEDVQLHEDNKEEKDYYLRTNNLLLDYYKTTDLIKNDDSDSEVEIDQDEISDHNGKRQFYSVKGKHNKANILNDYLSIVDPGLVTIQTQKSHLCPNCGVDLEINIADGHADCMRCGYHETFLFTCDKPTYKDSQPEISSYSYKRINHFVEWLNQFQAKESTCIPDEVFDLIYEEIKKHRITNLNELSPKKIREFLKKLKLNKYYEHTTYIINRLNGRSAPCISRDVEEKLKSMFKEIQVPFMKNRPDHRKNFLSYSYVLHKFVELLGLEELKNNFSLLKSRHKLLEQDKIWKGICEDLGWQFIPSL